METPFSVTVESIRHGHMGYWFGAAVGAALGSQRVGGGEYRPVHDFRPLPLAMKPTPELDLQLVWLDLVQNSGKPSSPYPFAGAYQSSRQVAGGGVFARSNLLRGLAAPASGSVANPLGECFPASASAAVFGCLCPGDPAEAARLAGLAASVDHCGEGVRAATFSAAVVSALFATRKLSEVVAIGLRMVPPESETAACVRAAVTAALETPEAPAEARKRIQAVANQPYYLYAPTNAGFFAYCLLTKSGSFQEMVALAVSLGGASAALGTLIGGAGGVLLGAEAIPEDWRTPLAQRLVTTGTSREEPLCVNALDEIVERSLKTAVSHWRADAPLTLVEPQAEPEVEQPQAEAGVEEVGETDPLAGLRDNTLCRAVWTLPRWAQVLESDELRVTFDFQEPPIVYPGKSNRVRVVLENRTDREIIVHPEVSVPSGWSLACRPSSALLRARATYEFGAVAQPPANVPPSSGSFVLTPSGQGQTFQASLLRPYGWMVVGPFPNTEGTGLDKHYLAEDVYGRDEVFMLRSNIPGKWQTRWVEGPWIPLEQDFGEIPGVIYLRTLLISREAKRVRIVAATDDGLVLWLNREKMLWYHDHHQAVPLPEPPYLVSGDLHKGENELMLKVLRCLHPVRGIWVYVLDDTDAAVPADLEFDETRA